MEFWKRLFFIVALMIHSCLFAAQTSYPGVYNTQLTGPLSNGEMGVYVFDEGLTTWMLLYDSAEDFGFLISPVIYPLDGTFSEENINEQDVDISGQFTNTGITANYQAYFGSGSVTGEKKSYEGIYSDKDGAYLVNFIEACQGGLSGNGYLIIAADGDAYFFLEVPNENFEYVAIDGGKLTASGSSISGSLLKNTTINLSLNSSTEGVDLEGTIKFSNSSCSGYIYGLLYESLDVTDIDGDSIPDDSDNCPNVPNEDQSNYDSDSFGDACDDDDDNDGVPDESDLFPFDETESADSDGDGVGDNSDNCPADSNPEQLNYDGDEEGDECDLDDDNDGYSDDVEIAAGTDPKNENSYPKSSVILKLLPILLE